jgi:hypothetical protein
MVPVPKTLAAGFATERPIRARRGIRKQRVKDQVFHVLIFDL